VGVVGVALRVAGAALRVLVVEDNRDTAETFALLLALDGHDVRVARHGVDALRQLDHFEPDVAFIDLGLPEMIGFELAHRLRADPRTQGIPLIAVTGYGRDEDKEQALAAGFTRHLTKPVSHDVVAALLAALAAPVLAPGRSSSLVH
jgi:CheY-like chemotaxis protein